MSKLGWISLHRKIMDNPLYFSEPFTRIQAWIDLLLIANHADGFFYIRGNKVAVLRGQVGMGSKKLAEKWKWSRGKATRFLNDMEKQGQIIQQKSSITSIISIVNYLSYQQCDTTDRAADDTTDGQQTGQQTDINNNVDKNNTVNNDKNSIIVAKSTRFIPPTIEEVKNYCLERKNKVDPEKFVDFYQSKNWMVGKNKMKDWKACVRTWEKEAKEKQSGFKHPATDYQQNNFKDDGRF